MTTLVQAQAMAAAYLEAETQILLGKEVRLGGAGLDRTLRMEDLDMVQAGRREWERRVNALQRSASSAPTTAGLGFSVADLSDPSAY